jgi:hypothetical protein
MTSLHNNNISCESISFHVVKKKSKIFQRFYIESFGYLTILCQPYKLYRGLCSSVRIFYFSGRFTFDSHGAQLHEIPFGCLKEEVNNSECTGDRLCCECRNVIQLFNLNRVPYTFFILKMTKNIYKNRSVGFHKKVKPMDVLLVSVFIYLPIYSSIYLFNLSI